jgi:hypothetical protein
LSGGFYLQLGSWPSCADNSPGLGMAIPMSLGLGYVVNQLGYSVNIFPTGTLVGGGITACDDLLSRLCRVCMQLTMSEINLSIL